MRTVIALLDDVTEAQRAARDLKKLGLPAAQISVVTRRAPPGACVDGLALLAMNLAGMGQVAAAGPVLHYLTPETARSSPDALIATLMRFGLPQADATSYVHGVRNGYTLEAAIVDDDRADDALAIMEQHTTGGSHALATAWPGRLPWRASSAPPPHREPPVVQQPAGGSRTSTTWLPRT
jgi:hypothetical protein